MDSTTAAIVFPPTIGDLGYATVNMNYNTFLAALGEEDGVYARDKYEAFKALGKAFNRLGWSDATLHRVVNAYKAGLDNYRA